MRRRTHIVVFFIVLALATSAGVGLRAQVSIGGIVNRYIQVLEIVPCDSSVRVASSTQFASGDLVLMIQMKGAQIGTNNDPQFGNIANIASAGSLEFLTIKSISTNWIEFATRMVNNYNPSGMVQMIKVARYPSARITSMISAPDWNGTIGGVVVLQIDGDLTFNQNINLDGKGFRGGNVSRNADACDVQDHLLNWNTGRSGEKGEGIASLGVNYPLSGRAPLGNGGGGGNGSNAGGAGGSNGGPGGTGGDANVYCRINMYVGGIPGPGISQYITQQKLFFGGGGGGAHQNDIQGTSGQNGGGLVIIRARALHGNGFQISANGRSVRDTAYWDGAGGGGAGGTIFIETDTITTPVFLSAIGGDGGHVKQEFNGHGPGGGGGGGTIVLTKPHRSINVSLSGGKPGIHTHPSNEAYLQTRNATQGKIGTLFDNGWTWKKPYSIALSVSGGGEFCPGESTQLSASAGFNSYVWSTGETTQAITVSTAGTYYVTTTDASGCQHRSRSLTVTYDPIKFTAIPSIDFGLIDYGKESTRNIVITNTDDEPITLTDIRGADVFTVTKPLSLPVSIPAGQTYNVEVSLTPTAAIVYTDTLTLILSKPCYGSAVVTLSARVDPVGVQFTLPDTSGSVGTTDFAIPVKTTVWPNDKALGNTIARITYTWDSRLFAPSHVLNATIVGDIIDRLAFKRTLTVETDVATLQGTDQTLMYIAGTILLCDVFNSTLNIDTVEFLQVIQQPTIQVRDGSLTTDSVCAQQYRQILVYQTPSLEVMPNPATDMVTIGTVFSAPGAYEVSITNLLGQLQYKESWYYNGLGDQTKEFGLNVSQWPLGTYLVVYTTPLSSVVNRIVKE